jgi:hypothetical protein
VGNRSTLGIDDVFRKLQLTQAREADRSERFVDLDAVDVAYQPSGARERLIYGGDGAEAKEPGLNRA